MSQASFFQSTSLDQLQALIRDQPAVLAYFSTPECTVCKALKPKVATLLETSFPRIYAVFVDCAATPDIAAQYSVFSVPTLVAFFDGKEWLRKGRSVGLDELRAQLSRPYALLFDSSPE